MADAPTPTVRDVTFDVFRRLGLTTIFANPGSTEVPFLTGLPDEAIEIIVAGANAAPSPLNAVLVEHAGGAVSRIEQDATAFDHRDAEYNLAIIGKWTDPADAEANIAWARGLWEAMQPFARGVYVNYLGVGDSAERVRAAYSPAKYARLAALKREYDPENIFRLNQNIAPATA